jgi:hypothetical protein
VDEIEGIAPGGDPPENTTSQSALDGRDLN